MSAPPPAAPPPPVKPTAPPPPAKPGAPAALLLPPPVNSATPGSLVDPADVAAVAATPQKNAIMNETDVLNAMKAIKDFRVNATYADDELGLFLENTNTIIKNVEKLTSAATQYQTKITQQPELLTGHELDEFTQTLDVANSRLDEITKSLVDKITPEGKQMILTYLSNTQKKTPNLPTTVANLKPEHYILYANAIFPKQIN